MTELSVVVPTFNEASNVRALVGALDVALQGVKWEVIFVDDDSPDGTSDTARAVGRLDSRVRCIQRIGRRGLSSACIEGMLSSSATYIAVLDGDLQHDESILPEMLRIAEADELDLVVGSRYVDGGGATDWSRNRKWLSLLAVRVARAVTGIDIKDITSGFFLARRTAILPAIRSASGLGFKILLDIMLSSHRPLAVREVPYHFRNRHSGESKMDYQVVWQFLLQLADRKLGQCIPARFLSFAFVGGLGVGVHIVVLASLYKSMAISFVLSQSMATLVAMTFNFALNNVFTYSDKRLYGTALLWGWLSFVMICSVGAVANVGVANYFYRQDLYWIGSGVAGILVGVVWNYTVSSVYTWKR